MDQKVGIAFCCERGVLERISMVMVESLLKYGSLTDKFELFCFSPRPAFKPGRRMLRKLQKLGINVIDQPLNTRYSFYPLMNKVVALKYLEENTTLDRLIFLDSDMIILNKISDKELMEHEVALQSDFMALKSDNSFNPFWTRLYQLIGVKEFSFTNSFVSGQRIFADWNSGLISYKRQLLIATKWYENLSNCFNHYHWRNLEYYFLEQSTLAVTLQQMKLQVHRLNPGFNYPICSHDEIHNGNKVAEFDNLYIIHYLRFADKSQEKLNKFEKGRSKVEWVKKKFSAHELVGAGILTRISDWYHSFRQANLQKIIYFYNRFSGKIK